MLEDLARAGETPIGVDETALDALLGALREPVGRPVSPDELWQGMPEYEQEDLGAWKSIKVHFASEEDYWVFSRLINQTLTKETKYTWYPAKEKFSHLDYECADES